MDLHDRISLCKGVMPHLRRQERIAARRKFLHLFLVKLVAHSQRNVPETTVTCSSVGCQCGAILYPAGIFSRTT